MRDAERAELGGTGGAISCFGLLVSRGIGLRGVLDAGGGAGGALAFDGAGGAPVSTTGAPGTAVVSVVASIERAWAAAVSGSISMATMRLVASSKAWQE